MRDGATEKKVVCSGEWVPRVRSGPGASEDLRPGPTSSTLTYESFGRGGTERKEGVPEDIAAVNDDDPLAEGMSDGEGGKAMAVLAISGCEALYSRGTIVEGESGWETSR